MTVVTLEVGHGPYLTRDGRQGFEEGANGPDTTEYKEVSEMAKLASEQLEKKGYEVKISDPPATLKHIGRSAAGSDIFISLHLNAFNQQVQGTEVLVHRNATNEDVNLAKVLQRHLVTHLGLPDRRVKRAGLAVLSTVPQNVQAACLSEAFFIDAVADAATARAMTKKAAQAIAEGIDEYARNHHLAPTTNQEAA